MQENEGLSLSPPIKSVSTPLSPHFSTGEMSGEDLELLACTAPHRQLPES